MRAHYLQHVPFEGLGSIESWLQKTGYEISSTRFYSADVLPEIEDIDLLVVMGGPMSANEEEDYPWLVKEKYFIKSVIQAGKPVLGICLGAQLIANSMGAEVFPNSEKEIGWFPVKAVDPEIRSVFRFPDELEVFHWHGETFRLPHGAVQIAESEGCKNQAFQIGGNVIGLQFHAEMTSQSVQAIIEHCKEDLVEGKYIQSEPDILSASQEQYASTNRLMENILEYLFVING
jgi:GMP synthase-like glutamine amidotransferase